MDTLKIEAKYRSDMSKSHMKAIRRGGYVTGSVFGHDTVPVSVEVKLDDLVHKIKTCDAGMMALIDMKIDGAPKKSDGVVIIKNFFKDSLSRKVLDIQFQRVSMKEKLRVSVPVVAMGEAPGVKEGGTLEQILDQLDVSCLPTDIPSRIEVDVTGLAMGHQIRVAELSIADNVEVLVEPEQAVFACVMPHVSREAEAEAEPVEGEAPAQPTETPAE
jgi:large subunit ribosomal protein L25